MILLTTIGFIISFKSFSKIVCLINTCTIWKIYRIDEINIVHKNILISDFKPAVTFSYGRQLSIVLIKSTVLPSKELAVPAEALTKADVP